jgi:nucleotide-binding universal stress UspA family protein
LVQRSPEHPAALDPIGHAGGAGVARVSDNGIRRCPGPVVVGVDGSDGSARALAWALREARDRQAAVRVVTAWAWGGASGTTGVSIARQARQNQEALVRAVQARFPGTLPPLCTELVQGDPASALIERSRDGDLLVLGCRGMGGAADAIVGSVADACLRHCSCPVVVVPSDPPLGVPEQDRGAGERAGIGSSVLGAVGLL